MASKSIALVSTFRSRLAKDNFPPFLTPSEGRGLPCLKMLALLLALFTPGGQIYKFTKMPNILNSLWTTHDSNPQDWLKVGILISARIQIPSPSSLRGLTDPLVRDFLHQESTLKLLSSRAALEELPSVCSGGRCKRRVSVPVESVRPAWWSGE